MNIRRVTSLTALISFILMLLTSIILYIVPQGRVAYWSDWHLWGLSKTEWGNLHINLGVLFLLAIFLHIYYNWKPIVNYMKNKAKEITVFTGNFNAALIITFVFALGTYFMIPPFSTILNISENIKDAAAVKYGEPPFGHAEEAPFDSLVKKVGLNFKESIAKLDEAGIKLEAPNQIFLEVAKKHSMTPQEVFNIINIKPEPGNKKMLPEIPPPGTGNRSLSYLCNEFDLDLKRIEAELRSKGIEVDTEIDLKSLASQNSKSSIELYDLIKEISKTIEKVSKDSLGGSSSLPELPTPGTGNLTLEAFSKKYQLDMNSIIKQLESKGMKVDSAKSLKVIASENNISPIELYDVIRSATRAK